VTKEFSSVTEYYTPTVEAKKCPGILPQNCKFDPLANANKMNKKIHQEVVNFSNRYQFPN
jgi:hypothetical protein